MTDESVAMVYVECNGDPSVEENADSEQIEVILVFIHWRKHRRSFVGYRCGRFLFVAIAWCQHRGVGVRQVCAYIRSRFHGHVLGQDLGLPGGIQEARVDADVGVLAFVVIQPLVVETCRDIIGTQQGNQKMALGVTVAVSNPQNLAGAAGQFFTGNIEAVGNR